MTNIPHLFFTVERTKRLRNTVFLLILLDFICFAINLKAPFIFNTDYVYSQAKLCMYWKYYFSAFFHIHILCSTFFIALSYIEYFRAVIRDSRLRNISSFLLFVFITSFVALHILFLFQGWTFDYSTILLGIMTLHLCYMNLYLKKRSSNSLMTMVYSENLTSAIFSFDYNKNCIFKNNNTYEIFNTDDDEKLNDIAQNYLNKEWIVVAREKGLNSVKGEEILNVNGEKHYFEVEYKILRDSKNEEICSYLQFLDCTEEIQKRSIEKRKSTHDSLTGLLNRNEFFKQTKIILEDNPQTEFYMIATNIKDFKFINDVFGTDLGDKILIEQAKILLTEKHNKCIRGRISSDRFGMLIPKEFFTINFANKNSERLQNLTKSLNYAIKIKIGVYEISNPKEDPVSIYDKATIASETASSNHAHIIHFYDTNLMDKLLMESNIINEFHAALKNNEFSFNMQPIFFAKNEEELLQKKCNSVELFARWNHPQRGDFPAEKFISILEKNSLIFKLDEYIWENACKYLQKWRNEKLIPDYFSINLNISAEDFFYKNLYQHFTELADRYNIPPKSISLEITEDVISHEPEKCIEILNALSDYGFNIVLDNFGKSFSSLNLIRDLKVNAIKIDNRYMSFNNTTTDDNEKVDRTIFTNFQKLTDDLNIFIIHTNMEQTGKINFLASHKYQLFQGNALSPTFTLSQFEKYLSTRGNSNGLYF
ncbi:MAG: EAL domain-containing protein [Treponema sp.]|nr:EAL domain-containing protein [Treponema sp.]